MVFPLDVRSDVAMCDIQFGVVARPTHPSSPWDAAKFEVCAHRFVDVSEPDFGVAVLNDGRYGHSVFDEAIRVTGPGSTWIVTVPSGWVVAPDAGGVSTMSITGSK